MLRFSIDPRLRSCVADLTIEPPQPAGAAEAQRYRVLPGPFPVIGCQYRGAIAALRGTSPQRLFPAGITGLQPVARWFVPDKGTQSVLVRLTPAGAVSLFGVDMSELAGAHVGLDVLASPREARELHERVAGACSPGKAADVMQEFLVRLLTRQQRRPHAAVIPAATRILSTHGNVRIRTLARQASVSERSLERLFRSEIGVTPKEFASLCRFDWVVRNAAPDTSWADMAIAAGYSDQAHLIRSFVRRAGVTPGKFASEMRISL